LGRSPTSPRSRSQPPGAGAPQAVSVYPGNGRSADHIGDVLAPTTCTERLDVFNGLLLAVHLDAAFDAALISFADDGALMISAGLIELSRLVLGPNPH
jgi:hypothetical protein